jgi:malate dehydrogenase (oxaloacetate-decarboxylating)
MNQIRFSNRQLEQMSFCIKTDPQTAQPYLATSERGRALTQNPFLNKGTAFTPEERRELDLQGVMPPAVSTMEQQLERVYDNFKAKTSSIEKYIFLTSLQDRNETLFFRLLLEHIEEMMPIVYTPTVGEACQRFSHIYRRARGLYISFEQRDCIPHILRSFSTVAPSVIVVTDGERILGLGDQGAGGMGIPIGKLNLYTLCAGIPPHHTLPITLDVGTNNAERLADPLYLGLRHQRIRGEAYQDFIDRFVAAVQEVFPNTLLQWEDFHKANALHQLARFRDQLCTFNDDVQGTAAVVISGLYAGLRLNGQALKDQRLLIAGAGAAAQGIADLFVSALREEGLSLAESRARVWTCDSKGLVTRDRSNLEEFKATYARDPGELAAYTCQDRAHLTLSEVILNARPTILVGTSGTPGAFDEASIRAMARVNDRPLIFPLSNPTSKCECTAEQAVRWSAGRAIVATGSPFAPVEFSGRRYRIGQCNNAYIFPGMGLGITAAGLRRVTDGMFMAAAKALAAEVSMEDLRENSLFPPLARIRECSQAVARAVIQRAVAEGQVGSKILSRLEDTVRQAMWHPQYLPLRYEPQVQDG